MGRIQLIMAVIALTALAATSFGLKHYYTKAQLQEVTISEHGAPSHVQKAHPPQ